MYFCIFDSEWDNPVNNPNIYIVERDNRLSLGLQPLTIEVRWKSFFFLSGSVIVFSMQKIVWLSSAKQNINILE